ncbi:MAG: type II toxin-antitoxin system VapC family toxin [Planctomycetes bacterium]|nr:type II toxin-antitoxin system VapC family toxin [Planctomycetota bacterium]
MEPTAYLETSIPSYLAARPSADLLIAAHQHVTHEWWQDAPRKYELYVSEAVLREIRQGNPESAARRLEYVRRLHVLRVNSEIRRLARLFRQHAGLAENAATDMAHVAYAVYYEADYLVTWNCTHIANREVVRRLTEFNREAGRHMPLIVTPEDLLSPDWEIEHEG